MALAASSWADLERTEPRYFYRAYGLDIASVFPVPELTAIDAGDDAIVRIGPVDHAPAPRPDAYATFAANEHGMYLRYPDVGTYRIRGGNEITVDPLPEAEQRLVRLFLTGPALAGMLHQRGLLVLHASVIRVGDGAVGYLGGPRVGKSTTAAALHARGYPLVSDDLLPLDPASSRPLVHPGFPQFKLWPETVSSLGGNPEHLPLLRADLEKRAQRVTERFEVDPLEVSALYVLAEADTVAIEALEGQEKGIELIRHSYFAPELPALGQSADHFHQCLELSATVDVFRLSRPANFDRLGATIDALEAHFPTAAPSAPLRPDRM